MVLTELVMSISCRLPGRLQRDFKGNFLVGNLRIEQCHGLRKFSRPIHSSWSSLLSTLIVSRYTSKLQLRSSKRLSLRLAGEVNIFISPILSSETPSWGTLSSLGPDHLHRARAIRNHILCLASIFWRNTSYETHYI